MQRLHIVTLMVGLVLLGAGTAATAATERVATASLDLQAELRLVSIRSGHARQASRCQCCARR